MRGRKELQYHTNVSSRKIHAFNRIIVVRISRMHRTVIKGWDVLTTTATTTKSKAGMYLQLQQLLLLTLATMQEARVVL